MKNIRPTFAMKALGAVGAVALVGLAVMANDYRLCDQENARLELQNAVMDRLAGAVQRHSLLQQLADGKTDDLKAKLSVTLAADAVEFCSLLSANPNAADGQIKLACLQLFQAQKRNPESFLSTDPQERLYEARAWTTARQAAAATGSLKELDAKGQTVADK